MKLSSISSGSSGNCILIENNNTSILVDAGISKKRIEEGLEVFGKTPQDIDGIVITHEHSDHIKGLGVLLRKYSVPVFGTEKTIKYILDESKIGEVDRTLFNPIESEHEFSISGIDLLPIHVSHDAADPVCYKFMDRDTGANCAVVTDLGEYDERIVDYMKDLNAVLVESNHDISMLQTGPYPYNLKRRIWGEKGHLSNEACGSFLNQILWEKLQHIILGHLSKENNYPELAYEAVRNEINMGQNNFKADDINIKVASRIEVSCMVEF